MKVLDMKKILSEYDDDTEILIYVNDRYQTMSFANISIDKEVPIEDALALSINIDEKDESCYIETGEV